MKQITHEKINDYYKLLGVPKNASRQQIKRAYRRLSKMYHPDAGGNDSAMFIRLNEAYETLMDENKRFLYDTIGFSKEELDEAARMMVHFVIQGVLKGKRYGSELEIHVIGICAEHKKEIQVLIEQLESAIVKMTLTLNELVGNDDDVFNQLFRKTTEGFILSNQLEKTNREQSLKMYEAIEMLVKHIDFTKEPDVQARTWTFTTTGNSVTSSSW